MLHLLHEASCLWPPKEAPDVPEPCPKADAAYPNAPSEALRALSELVGILGALSIQGPPLPGPTTHIARYGPTPGTLDALRLCACALRAVKTASVATLLEWKKALSLVSAWHLPLRRSVLGRSRRSCNQEARGIFGDSGSLQNKPLRVLDCRPGRLDLAELSVEICTQTAPVITNSVLQHESCFADQPS